MTKFNICDYRIGTQLQLQPGDAHNLINSQFDFLMTFLNYNNCLDAAIELLELAKLKNGSKLTYVVTMDFLTAVNQRSSDDVVTEKALKLLANTKCMIDLAGLLGNMLIITFNAIASERDVNSDEITEAIFNFLLELKAKQHRSFLGSIKNFIVKILTFFLAPFRFLFVKIFTTKTGVKK